MTPELRKAVERAGDHPVQLADEVTQRTYVLLSRESYERLLDDDDRRVQEAFRRVAKANAKARSREEG